MKLYSPDITKPTEVNYYWHEKVLVEPMPKPKQGEWIADDDGYKKCSNCGEYAPLSFDDYYMRGGKIRQEEGLLLCPYCGAKMKGE